MMHEIIILTIDSHIKDIIGYIVGFLQYIASIDILFYVCTILLKKIFLVEKLF